jgi:hypothetical protein
MGIETSLEQVAQPIPPRLIFIFLISHFSRPHAKGEIPPGQPHSSTNAVHSYLVSESNEALRSLLYDTRLQTVPFIGASPAIGAHRKPARRNAHHQTGTHQTGRTHRPTERANVEVDIQES